MQILEHLKDSKTHRTRKKILSGDGDDQYTVSIRTSDNRWVCSCKSFIFKHNKLGTDCKHITEIKEIYGNEITEESILMGLLALTKKSDKGIIASSWIGMRPQVEMLQLYCTFTPGKADVLDKINESIVKIQQLIGM